LVRVPEVLRDRLPLVERERPIVEGLGLGAPLDGSAARRVPARGSGRAAGLGTSGRTFRRRRGRLLGLLVVPATPGDKKKDYQDCEGPERQAGTRDLPPRTIPFDSALPRSPVHDGFAGSILRG